jgi:ADP-ribosyl-[dinitrogen reductase] hydrolase
MNPSYRFEGCLLGLACGDAVGTTVEFYPRDRFEPLTDMVGGGKFRLEAGKWTDDTSMAICLAESLLACEGFDPKDQMERYWQWADTGHNSSQPYSFGLGKTVVQALRDYQKTKSPYSGSKDPDKAGNGSLMRLAPISMYYADDLASAQKHAVDSSRTTHGAEECLAACEYFATLLVTCLKGVETKEAIIHSGKCVGLPDSMWHIEKSRYKQKSVGEITGSGYVVESLEAALWAFWRTDNFRDAILAAANLGDDADTTAAICGQLAGAYYGVGGIPAEWLDKLYRAEEIRQIAHQLYQRPQP